MKKTPKILPTFYKSKGTPIFRDTTALSFTNGGTIQFVPSEYGSDPREQYADGGPIYTYDKRPGSYYQRAADGSWMISNEGTKNQYVPIDDPTGQRTAILNKNAVVYNAPVQGAPKVTPAPIKTQQVAAQKNSPVLAEQKQYKQAQKEQKVFDSNQAKQQAYEQALAKTKLQSVQPADWVFAAPMVAPMALEALGAAAATEIPFMGGTTLGTAANIAGGIHGASQVPERIEDWQNVAAGNKDWKEATAQSLMTGLELYGGYGAAKTLLPQTYKINPLAGKLSEYNRVVGEDAIIDLQNSGLVRAGERGGVSTSTGTRTSAYPSFGKGAPKQAYIDQTIQQGKTPYIISTNKPMAVSTLGRHGKGSTMFPIDETGKYMPAFSANDVKVLNVKPHWLKGYQEVSNSIIPEYKIGIESGKAFKTLYPQTQIMPSGYRTYGQTQYAGPVEVNRKFAGDLYSIKNVTNPQALPLEQHPFLYSPEQIANRFSPEEHAYFKMLDVEKTADKLIKRNIDDRVYYDLNGNIIKTPSDNY